MGSFIVHVSRRMFIPPRVDFVCKKEGNMSLVVLVILGGLFVSIVLWDSLLKAGIVEDVMRWIVENLKGE